MAVSVADDLQTPYDALNIRVAQRGESIMRLIAVIALVVIGVTAWLVGQSKAEKADGPIGKTEEEIQELHNKLIQAQLNSDIAALDRIWADDHIFTNPLGVVQTKAQRLAEIQSGSRKLELFSVADVQVRVYGDTAVVTSRAMLKGQRQGQDISGQFRGIDVYVKKQGSWQVVAAQATRIAQP
jgi:ketosteroid isomerase-like protein